MAVRARASPSCGLEVRLANERNMCGESSTLVHRIWSASQANTMPYTRTRRYARRSWHKKQAISLAIAICTGWARPRACGDKARAVSCCQVRQIDMHVIHGAKLIHSRLGKSVVLDSHVFLRALWVTQRSLCVRTSLPLGIVLCCRMCRYFNLCMEFRRLLATDWWILRVFSLCVLAALSVSSVVAVVVPRLLLVVLVSGLGVPILRFVSAFRECVGVCVFVLLC